MIMSRRTIGTTLKLVSKKMSSITSIVPTFDCDRSSGYGFRQCGCKGIRSCRLCDTTTVVSNERISQASYKYCVLCGKAWRVNGTLRNENVDSSQPFLESQLEGKEKNWANQENCASQLGGIGEILDSSGGLRLSQDSLSMTVSTPCNHERSECMESFNGILILENFVTEAEETMLVNTISNTVFVNSQSGRRKQDYGPKVNFKRQKFKMANFTGLPAYSQFLYDRMKGQPDLKDFHPVELCNLEYCHSRGAHIDPHMDDTWLWGERLVTLNLLADSALTFTLDSVPDIEVLVPLMRRSLIVVRSEARYKWKHSISSGDIKDRRIAMTFRELSKEFSSGGEKEREGSELLNLALKFQGCAVGS